MVGRRHLLKVGSVGLAAAAMGAGWWHHRRRAIGLRESARIVETWHELGTLWLLPNLVAARLAIPDRPHAVREVIGAVDRAKIKCIRRFDVTTSARRMRDDVHGPQPAEGARRILVVGDSVSFGWGVEGSDAWPALLEHELASRGLRTEVLNAAVPSQNAAGMTLFLMRKARELGLHGVVFARRPLAAPNRYDAFAQAVRQSMAAVSGVHFHLLFPPLSTFDPTVFLERAEHVAELRSRLAVPLTDLADLFHERPGKTGCVLDGSASSHALRRLDTGEVAVEGRGGEHGLDDAVYAWLEANPRIRERYFLDQCHPDEEGHALIAPAVADAVVEAGWFG